jgi:hypothetical protein
MGQGNDLTDRFVDLQAILPRGHIFDEGAYPADNVAGPIAVLDDLIEGVLNFLQIGRPVAKPAQSRIGVGDHAGDRLVDFMRNRGRKLPHGRYAIDMRELRLRLAQRFRGQHQLAGPFHDALFEFLIEPLDFGLGLLVPGGFDDVPTPVPPCEGKHPGLRQLRRSQWGTCTARPGADWR